MAESNAKRSAKRLVQRVKRETSFDARFGQGAHHIVVEVPEEETYVGDVGKLMYDAGFHLTAQDTPSHRPVKKLQFHRRER